MNARDAAIAMIHRICPAHLDARGYGEILDAFFDDYAGELAHNLRMKAEEFESYGEVDRAEGWIEAADLIDPKVDS